MSLNEYCLQGDDEEKVGKVYDTLYTAWCKTWKKSFEDEHWKRISKFNEVLPNFHLIDKETFKVLGKIHMKSCQDKSHMLGLCGFGCKQTSEEKHEKQEKAMLLFRLIDYMEKQEDEEVKKKLIDLNPCFYGIVWGKESKEDFIKKIKKTFS